MRFYVASTFGDYPRARAFMCELRRMGHTITYDWTEDALRYPDNRPPPEENRQRAAADLAGVARADVLVALHSPLVTVGKWVEMGAAFALERTVISVGPCSGVGSGVLFASLSDLHVATDVEALDAIRRGSIIRQVKIREYPA